MTLLLAVASGATAVADLRRLLDRRSDDRDAFVEAGAHAVAWSTTSPWVSSDDDGETLVVLDGRLHRTSCATSDATYLRGRYRGQGDAFCRDVLGDFVAVVLDRERRHLLVSRDPLGVRPWYQADRGGRHVGATELSALCAIPWVDTRLDESYAVHFLAGTSQSRGPTWHRGIRSLPPGSTWRVGANGTTVHRHHTWALTPEPRIDLEEAAERSRILLDEAVRSRLAVTGPATCELSGGLDSSSIVGTAALLGCPDLLAGRLLFDGPADERRYSDAVADHWGIRLVSARPWLPAEDEWTDLARRIHRPLPDPNFTMLGGLHRALLAEGRNAAMTGLGGDDAFVDTGMESRMVSAVQLRQWDSLAALGGVTCRRPRETWRRLIRPTLRREFRRGRARPPAYVARSAAARHGLDETFAGRPVRLTGVRAMDERAAGLTSGHMTANLEDAAVIADLSGWRTTHPFLDPRLIGGLYGLDPRLPALGNHYRALEATAYSDRLPLLVRHRLTKAEFSETVWLNCLDKTVVQRLTTGPLVERGWLDLDQFDNVTRSAAQGAPHAALPLSRAVSLDRWLRLIEG